MAVIDLTGAFVYTETDENIMMVLKGKLTYIMAIVDPKLYRKYIRTDLSQEPVNVVRKNAYGIIGLLRSALLF